METMMNGAELIAAERQRQVDSEGWTPEHDDEHIHGQLAQAALIYTQAAKRAQRGHDPFGAAIQMVVWWPWNPSRWTPSDDPIRNLVKAGALIAAEIDRLQRRSGDDPTYREWTP
jgi:hypothetical protein